MTNSETIEKLNEALGQLIEAYENIKIQNEILENNIKSKDIMIYDLENKLDGISGTTKVQSTKMDTMLNKIQMLLATPKDKVVPDIIRERDTNNEKANQEDLFDEDIDLTINNTNSPSNKIDLGRMESLLNGLNAR
jgi:NACalpha-BTF3-like transcription factor